MPKSLLIYSKFSPEPFKIYITSNGTDDNLHIWVFEFEVQYNKVHLANNKYIHSLLIELNNWITTNYNKVQ